MARPKGSNSDTTARLREAAGRGFREGGYGGAGVDGLARAAGLTSGAFYAQFGSKAGAFRFAVVDGLTAFRTWVLALQADHGADWATHLVDTYLGALVQVELADGCTLATLTPDVIRADPETRAEYAQALAALVGAIADGLEGSDARGRAWALVSLLSGAANMARALEGDLQAAVLEAARAQARRLIDAV